MGRSAKPKISIYSVVVTVIAITLAAVLALLLLDRFRQPEREPVYTYVSLSEEAAARAYVWLSQIEDMPLTYPQIGEMMGEIRLTVVLTPTETEGIYTQAPAESSFESCKALAESGLERAYREVVRYRIASDGHEGEFTDEMLDDMMREAYGVSVSGYLSSCEIQLLPAWEDLTAKYAGEVTHE